MNPQEVAAVLAQNSANLREVAAHPPVEPLMQVARQVAGDIRATAARSGHQVGVRVVEKSQGIRVTITGPQAMRYKRLAEQAFDARMPNAHAELRAQITRRIR